MISGRFPFLFYSSCLGLGILLADRYQFSVTWFGYLLSILPVTVAFLISRRKRPLTTGRATDGFLIGISFILLGCASYSCVRDKIRISAKLEDTPSVFVLVRVTGLPEERSDFYRAFGVVVARKSFTEWSPVNEAGILLYFPKKGSDAPPGVGDYLVAKGPLSKPGPPMNPFEFDYRHYLENKQILWTTYLNPEDFEIANLPSFAGRSIGTRIMDLSNAADGVLESYLADPGAYGLIKAMLLGRRDDLRTEVNDAFVSSGTVHVLSVSGLHVGIFFMVIRFMLAPVRKTKTGSYLYLVILLVFLFTYTVMTGLPASVVRSGLMCALVAIADVFNRRSEPLNTLLFSAYLILLFDSFAIFDVGFQLSYLAMTGIFVLYEPVSALLSFRSRVLQKAWDVTAMSFAAQLLTFPLSIYYFHQFPVYFWLINPLIIDVSAVLLPLSFGLIICGWLSVSLLAGIMGWWTNVLALLTNWLASIPQAYLPGYLWKDLRMDAIEVLFFYLTLLIFFLICYRRSLKMLPFACLITLSGAVYSIAQIHTNYNLNQTVLHQVRQTDLISVKYRNKMYLIADSAWLRSPGMQSFCLDGYRIRYAADTLHYYWSGVKSGPVRLLKSRGGDWLITPHVVFFRGVSDVASAFQPDIHIVQGRHINTLKRAEGGIGPLFVGSADLKSYHYEQFKKLVTGRAYGFYDIRENGALVFNGDDKPQR